MRPMVVPVVFLFALAACSGTASPATTVRGQTDSASVTTTAPDQAGSGTTTVRAATTDSTVSPPTTAPAAVEVHITVEGGILTSERRVEVTVGDTVTLVVSSDAADELHLHGYDLTADVPAGQAAELTFLAEIPGIFEGELEGLHLQVLELVVNQ